jgi:hypothetical protein
MDGAKPYEGTKAQRRLDHERRLREDCSGTPGVCTALRWCPECSALFVPRGRTRNFVFLCANRPIVGPAERKRRLGEQQELRMGAAQGGKVAKS